MKYNFSCTILCLEIIYQAAFSSYLRIKSVIPVKSLSLFIPPPHDRKIDLVINLFVNKSAYTSR